MNILKKKIKQQIAKNILRTKPNIFFIHIPKTGGTSVNYAISQHYTDSLYRVSGPSSHNAANLLYGQNTDFFKLREYLALHEMLKGTKYVSGHIPFRNEIWQQFNYDYLYMTVLRHPVKRYISAFLYNSYKTDNHCKIESDWETYLASERAKKNGCEYVKYLGGLNNKNDYVSREAIKRAKANLKCFHLVGFLEQLNNFVTKLEKETGLKLDMPHQRKNPVSKPKLDSNILQEIEKNCQPDLEIYEYARTNFS